MLDGKRGTAQQIVYDAFERSQNKLNVPAMDIFNKALDNIMLYWSKSKKSRWQHLSGSA
jgi:ribosomal protein S7